MNEYHSAARALRSVFQPIVDVANRSIFGHEGLIRGPTDSALHLPAALFQAAAADGSAPELERLAAEAILEGHRAQRGSGHLFVNFSVPAIIELGTEAGRQHFHGALFRCNIAARSLVIDVTDHGRIADHAALSSAIQSLRGMGAAIALDDFGDATASLRLWTELQPEYVKLDRYFCTGIHQDGRKIRSVKALLRLAADLGSRVIAEGIEDAADLRVMRDLGVDFVQGWATGRPDAAPVRSIPAAALTILNSRDIAVLPSPRRAASTAPKAAEILITAPPVTAATTSQELLLLFQRHPHLHAVAVLDDGRPLGLVNRRRFMERYLLPYYPEIYGRQSCTEFMEADPITFEASRPLAELAERLGSADQRYLTDGFILVDAGRYVGISTAERLVRAIEDQRLEAARHAHPLTYLPGQLPVADHIRRLLGGPHGFALAHCDLERLKDFNHRFGYWQGDKLLKLLAAVIVDECDPQRDFAGHVGGDDFVIVFQSEDWRTRCAAILRRFEGAAPGLIESSTRFPPTELAIGAVYAAPGTYQNPDELATAANAARQRAKLEGGLCLDQ